MSMKFGLRIDFDPLK